MNGIENLKLTTGSYHLNVYGEATGTKGGDYNGAISISPVPETEAYSMMIFGLGLIGFVARRRRAN